MYSIALQENTVYAGCCVP